MTETRWAVWGERARLVAYFGTLRLVEPAYGWSVGIVAGVLALVAAGAIVHALRELLEARRTPGITMTIGPLSDEDWERLKAARAAGKAQMFSIGGRAREE